MHGVRTFAIRSVVHPSIFLTPEKKRSCLSLQASISGGTEKSEPERQTMPLEAAAPPGQPAASSLLAFLSIEAGFTAAFALILLRTRAQATTARLLGLALLGAVTHLLEQSIVQLCLTNQRPHWAAAGASLLWVQLLSASDLLLARRVESSQLRDGGSAAAYYASAVGLLWNMRRIGTRWQVKNVPSAAREQQQSRAGFVVSRVVATLVAYLVVDLVACAPPAEAHLVRADKATLLSLRSLGADDVVFRAIMTVIYWLITATLNLCMTNAGAIVAVGLGLSRPADCPPLYGSFAEAFTVRRFWG